MFESGAKRRVALGLILGKIIRDNEIKADPARVRETVERLAASYEHPQQVVDYYYSDAKRLSAVQTAGSGRAGGRAGADSGPRSKTNPDLCAADQ
jgi:FKBP-type peptidyl-prolyl cis-trans isomerase (trigger factor)